MSSVNAHAAIHPSATQHHLSAGPFTVVEAGATLGRDVNLGSHVVVSRGATIGDRVALGDAAIVGRGAVIEDDVIVGERACVSGSIGPGGAMTIVRAGVTVGSGAVISAGADVGEGAVIRDGAVVSRQVPRNAVVSGNPAVITGYTSGRSGKVMEPVRQLLTEDTTTGVRTSTVSGVSVHRLPVRRDIRGSLVAGEVGDQLPFLPQRYFLVFDVPSEEVRGEHAHHRCHQFLICVAGHLHVIADDGRRREEFVLEDSRTGLYLPPMTWGIQYRYSAECVLMVLASDPYDALDYIRDYEAFLEAVAEDAHG